MVREVGDQGSVIAGEPGMRRMGTAYALDARSKTWPVINIIPRLPCLVSTAALPSGTTTQGHTIRRTWEKVVSIAVHGRRERIPFQRTQRTTRGCDAGAPRNRRQSDHQPRRMLLLLHSLYDTPSRT